MRLPDWPLLRRWLTPAACLIAGAVLAPYTWPLDERGDFELSWCIYAALAALSLAANWKRPRIALTACLGAAAMTATVAYQEFELWLMPPHCGNVGQGETRRAVFCCLAAIAGFALAAARDRFLRRRRSYV